MTLQQVRECAGDMLLSERLKVCNPNVAGSPSAHVEHHYCRAACRHNKIKQTVEKIAATAVFAAFVFVTY